GDLETRWDKGTLLTVATLYWATATIGSSFRQYYNYPLNERVPQITVPGAVTLSNEPAYANFPRSLAERLFTDLRHWTTPQRGGHFMAHENPARSPASCVSSSARSGPRTPGPRIAAAECAVELLAAGGSGDDLRERGRHDARGAEPAEVPREVSSGGVSDPERVVRI
ncbi:MAG: hypothetical protein ACRDOK_30875, partial [Streptosporangiaceae bacterium]